MGNIYLYARFSSDQQKDGDSERRQKQAGQAWAKANNQAITKVFFDKGLSGMQGANRAVGEFAAMVKVLKTGDTILVENADRIGRDNPLDALNDLQEIIFRGVKVVFLSSGQVVDKSNFITALLPLFVNQFVGFTESTKKAERVAAAWGEKRRNAAKGMTVTKALPAWVSANGDDRVLNERVDVVRRLFREFNSGRGIGRIVRDLNTDRVKPFGRGKQSKTGMWSSFHVRRILQSKTVLGEYQPYRQTKDGNGRVVRTVDMPVVPDYYPRAVTNEEFYAAQVKFERHTKAGGRKTCANNLFSGIAKCAHCGGGMHFQDKPKAGGRYRYKLLRCAKALHRGDCKHRGTVQLKHVEGAVLSLIWGVIAPRLEETNSTAILETKKAELADVERTMARLVEMGKALGTDDVLLGELAESKGKKDALKAEIARLAAIGNQDPLLSFTKTVNTVESRIKLQNILRGEVEKMTIDTTAKTMALVIRDFEFKVSWDYQRANHVKQNPADLGFSFEIHGAGVQGKEIPEMLPTFQSIINIYLNCLAGTDTKVELRMAA